MQTASGKTIPLEDLRTDYDTLYRTFADSWRITQAASLFTDKPGNDATAFNDPTFPDRTVPPVVPADLAASAKAACVAAGLTGADLADCELDVASTGDTGYAAAAGGRGRASFPGLAPDRRRRSNRHGERRHRSRPDRVRNSRSQQQDDIRLHRPGRHRRILRRRSGVQAG